MPDLKLSFSVLGNDFLMKLQLNSKRLSAKRALLHPYFDSLDKQALPAKPGEYQIKWIYPQTVSTQPKTNTSAVPKTNQVKK